MIHPVDHAGVISVFQVPAAALPDGLRDAMRRTRSFADESDIGDEATWRASTRLLHALDASWELADGPDDEADALGPYCVATLAGRGGAPNHWVDRRLLTVPIAEVAFSRMFM